MGFVHEVDAPTDMNMNLLMEIVRSYELCPRRNHWNMWRNGHVALYANAYVEVDQTNYLKCPMMKTPCLPRHQC